MDIEIVNYEMDNLNIWSGLPKDWKQLIDGYLEDNFFDDMNAKLTESYRTKVVYPNQESIFKVFQLLPYQEVKVIILGQDPYHGPMQAQGLSFSVPAGLAFPPSLRNIFKELKNDLDIEPPFSGDLSDWVRQGVLLMNAILTVESKQAGSHSKLGWERFTDLIIKRLSDEREDLVFVLWGNFAKKKMSLIDLEKHTIIQSAHPSPLSAYNGFFGSKPFSTINNYLISKNKKPINWSL